jgi:hypothetical protein
MSKKILVWVVVLVAVLSLSALVLVNERTHAPSETSTSTEQSAGKLPDIKVTYVLSEGAQKMYNMVVESNNSEGQAVIVHGKACNTMNSTISIIAKGTATNKKVVKTLNDGRQVLEPITMSTLMACMDTTPQTDDNALNAVINELAASLESY